MRRHRRHATAVGDADCGVAIVQIAVGGALGLGLAGLPQLGMRGVAAGQFTAFSSADNFCRGTLVKRDADG